jgi:hypothetical protein
MLLFHSSRQGLDLRKVVCPQGASGSVLSGVKFPFRGVVNIFDRRCTRKHVYVISRNSACIPETWFGVVDVGSVGNHVRFSVWGMFQIFAEIDKM